MKVKKNRENQFVVSLYLLSLSHLDILFVEEKNGFFVYRIAFAIDKISDIL